MKKPRIRLTVAALLAVAATASAQQPASADYKVGYVNPERVMREARESQKAQKSLEAEFQKRNQEIAGAEQRLQAMVADLEKNAVTLPAAERQKRERAAGELQRDIERRKTVYTEELNQRRDDAQKQIVEKANAMIRRVAEEEKFDAVFVEAAYADPRIDITDRVIKALDAAP